MEWRTYLWRWNDLYKKRLSGPQWVKAAFAMPFIPAYYRKVGGIFYRTLKARIKRMFQRNSTPEPETRSHSKDGKPHAWSSFVYSNELIHSL